MRHNNRFEFGVSSSRSGLQTRNNLVDWIQNMEKYDNLEIRCPRLGGEVTFAYCKRENGNLPCPRTIRCWSIYFPVESYLREILTEDEWDTCFNQQPKDKISSIFEIVEKLKNQKKE
jgi:hypothetical protein